tara:strand:- start:98 stop:229 length:132 start_codon:yes stop_codon:yes gene_type:complete
MLIKKANCVAAIALNVSPMQSDKLADIIKEPRADNNTSNIDPT